MCKEILGKEAANKLKIKPASILNRLNSKPIIIFSIQLDKSTDVQNKAILSVFVRYYFDRSNREDFLYCSSLNTTTGTDIYSS